MFLFKQARIHTIVFLPTSITFQSTITNLQRGRDSNPRYAFGVYTLSRRAPSTTRPPLYYKTQRVKINRMANNKKK